MNQLVRRWPEQPQYQFDLATNLNQLGVSYSRINRTTEALESFKKALDQQCRLAGQFPQDAEIISTTGSMFNNVGFLWQRLQQHEQAIKAFEDAVKYQTEATKLAPTVNRYAENLKKHQANLRMAQGKSR